MHLWRRFTTTEPHNCFALIRRGRPVFGADNMGDWHMHSLDNPEIHVSLDGAKAFSGLVAEIEKNAAVLENQQDDPWIATCADGWYPRVIHSPAATRALTWDRAGSDLEGTRCRERIMQLIDGVLSS